MQSQEHSEVSNENPLGGLLDCTNGGVSYGGVIWPGVVRVSPTYIPFQHSGQVLNITIKNESKENIHATFEPSHPFTTEFKSVTLTPNATLKVPITCLEDECECINSMRVWTSNGLDMLVVLHKVNRRNRCRSWF